MNHEKREKNRADFFRHPLFRYMYIYMPLLWLFVVGANAWNWQIESQLGMWDSSKSLWTLLLIIGMSALTVLCVAITYPRRKAT